MAGETAVAEAAARESRATQSWNTSYHPSIEYGQHVEYINLPLLKASHWGVVGTLVSWCRTILALYELTWCHFRPSELLQCLAVQKVNWGLMDLAGFAGF
jgi:hypothetical protein